MPQSAILMDISRSIFVVALSIYVNFDSLSSPMGGCVRIDSEALSLTVIRDSHDRSRLEKALGQVAAFPLNFSRSRLGLLAVTYCRACIDPSKATKMWITPHLNQW